MRIGIIGGTGFIGSALAAKVRAMKEVPVVISRRARPGFRDSVAYRRANAGDFREVRRALSKCDVAVHCAWSTTPHDSDARPHDDMENIATLITTMMACAEARVQSFVFLSSGGTVYGLPNILPIPEGHPTEPVSAHGSGKLAAEAYVRQMGLRLGMNTVIARIANPYGPGQPLRPEFGVVPRLMRAVTGDRMPFPQYNRGASVRDFVYIDDVADALFALCDMSIARHRVYNIGTGIGHSVADLRRMVEDIADRSIATTELPARPFDVPEVTLDYAKIRQERGWFPKTSILDGLKKTYEWSRDVRRRRR